MAQQTATPLDQMPQRVFEMVDALDVDAITALMTEDAQEVDEISRGWMRGRGAVEAYFGQVKAMIDQVHTRVSDVHAREWGDTGVVTCVIDQTYRMKGEEQRITAPTSMTLRREGGEWKIALLHSVPLPEAAGG